jgi:hypothetical protein
MKLQTIFFGIGVLAVSLSPAAAQDQKLIPVPPYLAPVPSSGHWTITLKHSSSLSPNGAAVASTPLSSDEPLTIDTIQGGGISCVTLNFQKAPPVQIDRKGDYYIRRTSTGVQLFGTANGTLSFFALDDGFLFAEWVRQEGAAAFQKVVQYEGVTCFYYQNHKPETQKDPNNGQEVWIDVHTMLPVAAKADGIEADYQFHDPPTSPPPLPLEEANLIQARENALKIQSSIR